MSLSSWRKLSDGRVAVFLVLTPPSGECEAIEVVSVGSDVQAVLTLLRRSLDRIRRPERGARPTDEDVRAWSLRGADFIWRPFGVGSSEWRDPSEL